MQIQALQNLRQTVSTYKELSKGGIVALVLISVLGGYFCGHPLERPMDWSRLILTLLGVFALASGSSALNQLQEHRLDAEMPRTAKRPLPSGRVSRAQVATFVIVSLLIGTALLWVIQPGLFWLGLAAVLSYNGFYTLWWKRRWAFAAIPGAVPGALPILMGYAAAQEEVFTPGGIYLFAILFFWQMPHFWALAIRYTEDYRLGGIPTLPVAKGSGVTVFQITTWCLAYVGIAMAAPLFLRTGWIYEIIAAITSLKVLLELRAFRRDPESKKWLHFFLWVNFSLILYIFGAVIDIWSLQLPSFWT